MIYLDNAATTRMRDEVLSAMLPYMQEEYGNPSAVYSLGRQARRAIDTARKQIADLIGADIDEIYFTSGGTEADNWALSASGISGGGHIITSAIEHHAVLNTCKRLESRGYKITYVPVNMNGEIDPDDIKRSVRPDTKLISIMAANNETGVIQPVKDIGRIAEEYGVLFHTDAVQAFGSIDIDVDDMHIDMLSVSAHKHYGPKGIGALYCRKGSKIRPLINGGSQERNLRAGTENTAAVVGFGEAARLAALERSKRGSINNLRLLLESELISSIEGTAVNGGARKLPGISNIYIKGVDANALIVNLDMRGIAASNGAACTSGSTEPSHVLMAMGFDERRIASSIRLSIGMYNTEEDIKICIEEIKRITNEQRKVSNLFSDKSKSVLV